MASKFNFGKRLRVTGHEYRKMDYGASSRCGCSCENHFVSKRWHPSFKTDIKLRQPQAQNVEHGPARTLLYDSGEIENRRDITNKSRLRKPTPEPNNRKDVGSRWAEAAIGVWFR